MRQEWQQSSSTPACALALLNTVYMYARMYTYVKKHFPCQTPTSKSIKKSGVTQSLL